MDRRTFLSLSPAVLAVNPSFGEGQSTDRTDGNWWKGLASLAKYGYVVGYADGSEKADATWADGECKTLVTAKYLAAVQKQNDYSGITIGQYVEGVDQFYKDFRNTRILETDAMMIVKWQISGADQNVIDESLQTLRKIALNPNYQ
jgi:hypothetical protein